VADRERLNEFLRGETWAVVGASDDRSKFGNITFRELKRRGKRVFPVNRRAGQVEGEAAYATLSEIPEHVDRVLVVVPPRQSERVVREADEAGIDSVWFQPGAESVAALAYCEAHGMVAISGRCILMTAEELQPET
jgi:predicted CoA-binding protein